MTDRAIPDLPAISEATSADLLHIVQGGNSRKATLAQLAAVLSVPGSDGRAVELSRIDDMLCWRLVGDLNWIDLVPLDDIEGPAGKAVEIENIGGAIHWRLSGDEDWAEVVALEEIKGDTGDVTPEAEAARAATADDRRQTGEDREATAADRLATGEDREAIAAAQEATAADRVATGEDRAATHADALATAGDRAAINGAQEATGADAQATAADRVATGEDREATGLDRIATAADREQTALDVIASAENAASADVNKITWRGPYAAGTAYVARDAVSFGNSSWIAKVATTGNAPPALPTTQNTWWELMASKGDAYETYGVSVYRAAGILTGGYYAERYASAASTQGRLVAEIIAGNVGAEVDFYVEVNGVMAYGPVTVVNGTQLVVANLALAVPVGAKISFIVTRMVGNVTEFFAKTYGALS